MFRIKSFNWKKISSSKIPLIARANLLEVDVLAKKHDWIIKKLNSDSCTVELHRNGVEMVVYLITFNIQTQLVHPNQGPTLLTRKNLNKREINKIFKHPRAHTNKGFHKN